MIWAIADERTRLEDLIAALEKTKGHYAAMAYILERGRDTKEHLIGECDRKITELKGLLVELEKELRLAAGGTG